MEKKPTFDEVQAKPELTARPTELPPRAELVESMLAKTRRMGTPIRHAFVQLPTGPGPRASMLARFRSASHLDSFLLIHALASAKAPYEVVYPAASWARALGLDENSGSTDEDLSTAKTQWSKNVGKLVELGLIDRKRYGSRARWVLLDESGDGREYLRPKSVRDGRWLILPSTYWTAGHYLSLSFAAKVMLLISLSSKQGFTLPLERVKEWYGISRSTAQRGLSELEHAGILTFKQSWRVEPNSPTQWAEVREYSLLGQYAPEVVRESMKTRRAASPNTTPDDNASLAEVAEILAASPRRRSSKQPTKGGDK